MPKYRTNYAKFKHWIGKTGWMFVFQILPRANTIIDEHKDLMLIGQILIASKHVTVLFNLIGY